MRVRELGRLLAAPPTSSRCSQDKSAGQTAHPLRRRAGAAALRQPKSGVWMESRHHEAQTSVLPKF